ncbi:MAG TPA: chemotaxis protein CheW [Candidatus Dormibacteraeota bacterium]|nr:chemotaxis protein CheW [Candidatus Dormibacteraeota bacterium]
MRALLIPLGDDVYAVPVAAAREVVSDPRPTPVPTAPACIRGLLNVRGDIVPLLDLGILLGAAPAGSCTYAVVVDTAVGRGALVATALPEVGELAEVVAAPELPGALAVHRSGARLVTLLDLDTVLDPARIGGA